MALGGIALLWWLIGKTDPSPDSVEAGYVGLGPNKRTPVVVLSME